MKGGERWYLPLGRCRVCGAGMRGAQPPSCLSGAWHHQGALCLAPPLPVQPQPHPVTMKLDASTWRHTGTLWACPPPPRPKQPYPSAEGTGDPRPHPGAGRAGPAQRLAATAILTSSRSPARCRRRASRPCAGAGGPSGGCSWSYVLLQLGKVHLCILRSSAAGFLGNF